MQSLFFYANVQVFGNDDALRIMPIATATQFQFLHQISFAAYSVIATQQEKMRFTDTYKTSTWSLH